MDYKLIGVKDYDFEKDGKHFNGTKLFCTYEDANTTGMACEAFTISADKLKGFKPLPGIGIKVYFNKYGKVEEIAKV